MKVADVMQEEVVTISPEATLRSASRVIFSGQIGGLPVVDQRRKLVGIIVEKDILSLFFPPLQEYVADYTHAKDFESMEEKVSELLDLPIKKFMTKNPLTIEPEAPLMRAAALMITKRVRKLPVVNKRKKLVGIISQGDIFRRLVQKRIPSLQTRARRGPDFFSRFARYYDISFSWDQRLTEEIPFLVKHLKKNKVKTVLDLGCGTGEHAIALAKRDFKVIGVDNNEEMLANALEKREKQEEKVKQNLEFVHLSIRDLASLKGRQFDAALCLGNVMANILDYKREFLPLKRMLTPKALFIIQVRNFANILTERERFIRLDFSFPETASEWEKEYAFLRFYNFRTDGLLDFNVETLASDGRIWHSYGVETTVRKPILKRDLTWILKKLGFTEINFFGNFNSERYNQDKSRRLIAVATR